MGFISKFMVLRGATHELWVVFAAKLMAILAYGIMNSTLVLWLSSDLGYGDVSAGNIIMIWSLAMTLCTIMVGSLVDAIGLRKAFLLGISICLVSRGIMTFFTYKWLVLICGLMPLALGEALMTPVMVAAVRRYSNTSQRSISFSIFYVMMNAGFMLASLIFDYLRKHCGENGHIIIASLGLEFTTYRLLFLCSFLCTLPCLFLMYFCIRDGVEATDEGVKITPEQPGLAGEKTFAALSKTAKTALRDTGHIFAGLWKQPTFHKFLAFLFLVVAVRILLYHMYYTYPKFGVRELGDGAPIGQLWGLNPFLIIILVPFVGAFTQKISAYSMIVAGTSIAAASVFIMTLPPQWFQGLTDGWLGTFVARNWLGVKGVVSPYYVMIFLFVILMSIGESLWSPRLYEYTAAIAPKGQEGSYMSLSYLPFFLAKFLVGPLSGALLVNYCPKEGPRDCQTLWLYIALPTLIAPLGLLLLRRSIRVEEAGRAAK